MLKKIRVVIALLVGLSFCLLFVDFRSMIPEGVVQFWADTQFVPALLRVFRIGFVVSLALIALLVLTLLTGRTYCSFLCPLGILQDLFSRIGKRLKWAQKYNYHKPLNYLRYALLVLTTIVFAGGSAVLLNLLDPYSIFGRSFSYLVQPVVILANNLLAVILNSFDVYSVYRVKLPLVHWPVILWTAGFMLLIAFLSFRRGRLYCNSVCPVGTLLGLLSRVSLFKVRLGDSCTSCGKCARVCKAECIDSKAKTVDSSRCVSCFNCLNVCHFDAISYKAGRKSATQTVTTPIDVSKRKFFKQAIAGSSVLTLMASRARAEEVKKVIKSNKGLTPLNRKFHASPPGSESLDHFNSTCTGCSLCVTACPTNVLQPALFEYGLSGMMQPFMDFSNGLCNYECTICGDVCPTGAIFALPVAQKKRTQLGVAKFIKANCVVETDKTDCGACSEHCPTKAVNMVPYGKLLIPEVKEDICVGCGACEYACPVTPFKAIFVDGHSQHQEAKEPKNEKAKIEIEEDFPF